MKLLSIFLFTFFCATAIHAQQEFHVFPKTHENNPAKPIGSGSLVSPWDLQTALSQKPERVNGSDTIWLHEGVYSGRFFSTLKSTIKNQYITVSAYKGDKVILNGNVTSEQGQTLGVRSANVIFKDFEITWLGDFNRDARKEGFNSVAGINHLSGENCKFINLIIHNNPGLGFGSWKHTGGTLISNCLVFNNGFIRKDGKGGGEGFYVQNTSDFERVLKDNIIFNNYYKGVEVWSANRKADYEYVKNISLMRNVIFNSGLPSGRTVDNIIVASDDRNGVNIAKNITVENNILYHNTAYEKQQVNGDAPSLTLGFHKNAPVENVVVKNNIILGRNNALRVLYAKSLQMTNNTVYSGYVHFNTAVSRTKNNSVWEFDYNTYYTKKNGAFRIPGDQNYSLNHWNSKMTMEQHSTWKHIKNFDLDHVLDLTKNEYKPNTYRIVLFNKKGEDVIVDFSEKNLKSGMPYIIKDVENYEAVLSKGVLNENFKIQVPMTVKSDNDFKTLNNFGVYIIEFQKQVETHSKEKKGSFINRFFNWLF